MAACGATPSQRRLCGQLCFLGTWRGRSHRVALRSDDRVRRGSTSLRCKTVCARDQQINRWCGAVGWSSSTNHSCSGKRIFKNLYCSLLLFGCRRSSSSGHAPTLEDSKFYHMAPSTRGGCCSSGRCGGSSIEQASGSARVLRPAHRTPHLMGHQCGSRRCRAAPCPQHTPRTCRPGSRTIPPCRAPAGARSSPAARPQ